MILGHEGAGQLDCGRRDQLVGRILREARAERDRSSRDRAGNGDDPEVGRQVGQPLIEAGADVELVVPGEPGELPQGDAGQYEVVRLGDRVSGALRELLRRGGMPVSNVRIQYDAGQELSHFSPVE